MKRNCNTIRKNMPTISRYLLLLVVGSVIILPLMTLLSTAGKNLLDLVDPQVYWLPTYYQWGNFVVGFRTLGGLSTFRTGLLLMGAAALGQVLIAMVTAYGLAKYRFPGQRVLFLVMMLTFFIPREVTFLPQYILFSNYDMLGTAWTLLLPSWLGQGVKGALMVLLYYQFFRTMPKALDEAAMLDGATLPGILVNIGIPLSFPATIISSILSFAWNWNDTYFARTYFNGKIVTPALALGNVQQLYSSAYAIDANSMENALFHGGIEAAAGLLVILPLRLLYLIFQRKLIESVDRAGMTGE